MSVMLDEIRKYVEINEEDLEKPLIFKKKDDLYFMILNKPKVNSFNHDQIRNIVACCDEIQESHGPACLITLSLNDKIFSGGIDLKYTAELGRIENIKYFILELIAMFGRVTMLNIPTIAVVKGACIAGGFMLTSSHDLVYVVDKAIFACNQVDIGLPLPPGMNTVIKRKHTNSITFRDMTLFGKKFTEKELLENRMIDGIVHDLKPVIEKAKQLSKYASNRSNFRNLKAENNKEIVDACFNKQHAVGSIGQFKITSFPKL